MSEDRQLDEALALHRAGRIGEAEARYRALLEANPRHASALHLLGVIALQSGRPAEAEPLIARAIAERPDSAAYHNNLGTALRELGRADEALAAYRRGAALDPALVDVQVNLGAALRHAGALEEARGVLERARALAPRSAALFNALANVVDAQGEPGRAIDLYRKALDCDPAHAEAALNLGRALLRQEQFPAALPVLERAAAAAPRDANAWTELGNAQLGLERRQDAAQSYRRAIELDPRQPNALANLGILALDGHRYDESARLLRRALEADPNARCAHNGLGVCATHGGRYAEALEEFNAELAANPDDADAHMNIGILRLLAGELEAAWPEYEHRLRRKSMNTASGPRWSGEPLGERTLLVYPEQGAGDNIQFVRYLKLLREANPRATIVYPVPDSLRRLFSPILEAWRIEAPQVEQVEITGFQCALLSLPALFKTTLATIPAAIPYLRANADDAAAWRQRLAALPAPRVGLVWAGNPGYRMDRDRNLPTDEVARLLEVQGASFVSLQKGQPAHSDAALKATGRLADWMGEVQDFAQTAALVEALDLVISVDTSVAHLAGALGKPVWLANRFSPDWRWMLERSDSPWYPTLRIFRQPAHGDWAAVTEAMRGALGELVSRGR